MHKKYRKRILALQNDPEKAALMSKSVQDGLAVGLDLVKCMIVLVFAIGFDLGVMFLP